MNPKLATFVVGSKNLTIFKSKRILQICILKHKEYELNPVDQRMNSER